MKIRITPKDKIKTVSYVEGDVITLHCGEDQVSFTWQDLIKAEWRRSEQYHNCILAGEPVVAGAHFAGVTRYAFYKDTGIRVTPYGESCDHATEEMGICQVVAAVISSGADEVLGLPGFAGHEPYELKTIIVRMASFTIDANAGQTQVLAKEEMERDDRDGFFYTSEFEIAVPKNWLLELAKKVDRDDSMYAMLVQG